MRPPVNLLASPRFVALDVQHNVPLAPRTSLELGGPARYLVEAADEATVIEALRWADDRQLRVLVLGGGSNVLIGDEGWDGLAIHLGLRGLESHTSPQGVRLRVAAAEPWDDVVATAAAEGWAGIECLSGIPGSTGATPIQNVGAYGQEVADVIAAVHVWDRRAGCRRVLLPDACGFGYRDSVFKRDPTAAVVLAVELLLQPGGAPTLRYGELARAMQSSGATTVAQTREHVLGLRRRKSMVIDPEDPNRRSAGSFFTNAVVDTTVAEALVATAMQQGLVDDAAAVPRYALDDGQVKIPAAWLIEAAGFRKGERRGAVGISSRHALALVHHGGGRTRDLVAFAQEIRDRVQQRFGIELRPEPVFAGVTLR